MEEITFISPRIVREKIPLTETFYESIATWRQSLIQIVQGIDPRQLLIVGPCSIHNTKAALKYAKKLKILSDEVSDVFMIIMRTYFEKPRTLHGWKGLLYDPHLDGSCDITSGILLSRTLLSDLTELGMPSATEFLDPLAAHYLNDFISWGSIGARTSQSQIHRQLASSLSMPIGFKNRPDGNIESTIQSILSAKDTHSFLGINEDGEISKMQGKGNICPHLVLRGGETKPNYDLFSIRQALEQLEKVSLPQGLIIDCSHDNSRKNHKQQANIFSFLIDQIIKGTQGIRGMMLESFLLEANQPAYRQIELSDESIFNCTSITDPCLSWSTTEQLIREAAERLRQSKLVLNNSSCLSCNSSI